MTSRFRLLFPTVSLVFLVSGCGDRDVNKAQLTQAQAEEVIRAGMMGDMQLKVESLSLKKEGDRFVGEATITNGDRYDVRAIRAVGQIEWKAVPGQLLVEKMVREGLEKKHSGKVKKLELHKHEPGIYSGTAILDPGIQVKIETGMGRGKVVWEDEVVGKVPPLPGPLLPDTKE